MALEVSRFFDAINKDRNYSAEEFAEYFRTLFSQGVMAYGPNLQITAGTGMTLQAGYGAAFVHGYGYWLKDNGTGVKTVTLPVGASQPRIDRVVLQLDKSLDTRFITITYKTGTPAASPVAPELVRSGNIYEVSLARMAVAANVTSLTAANITDERPDIAVCGRVEPEVIREYLNQSLKTTDSPTFAGLTVTGTITANKVIGAVYQ